MGTAKSPAFALLAQGGSYIVKREQFYILNCRGEKRQWACRVWFERGDRTNVRRLFDNDGKPILVSDHIHDNNDFFKEDPLVLNRISLAKSNIVAEETFYRTTGKKKTSQKTKTKINGLMNEFLDWCDSNQPGSAVNFRHIYDNHYKDFFDKDGFKFVSDITDESILEFSNHLNDKKQIMGINKGKSYSKASMKQFINFGQAFFSWMKDPERKYWSGDNPFDGKLGVLIRNNKARYTKLNRIMTRDLTDEELSGFWQVLQQKRFTEARHFWYIQAHTGNRGSEILRCDEEVAYVGENFDHDDLTLIYWKSKCAEPHWRTIPIPRCLSVYLINNGLVSGQIINLKETAIRDQLKAAAIEAGLEITPKTGRKVHYNTLRRNNVERYKRNMLQGRSNRGTDYISYSDDDVVRVCREDVDRVFAKDLIQGVSSPEK